MIDTPQLSDPSLVYMYGISDFWVDMFGDSQLVETLLAGETAQLAEAYSYFLQRAAGISLEDIQDKYQTRIKLLLLGEDDLVTPGDLSSFKVDTSIVSVNKLVNRPILPTQTMTYGIHFDIDGDVMKFHKPIDQLKFPIRYNSDGTWQYAVWMCDVEINDRWIDSTFGRLVNFTEDNAIFNYKSFLEGVYFLYTNGPNISNIVRGVNLAMGMPYARETEQVLDITQDEVTSNWVVFTSRYAYEIPYSYQPDLSVGDILSEGEVLSTWVEVIDYSTSGAWWYQIYLPREIVGEDVDPYEMGKAVEGSTADAMMNNFLKHHMFEVLITQPSSDITAYNTARELVLRAKPEYTYPVFVWKASIGDEYMEVVDDFSYTYKADLLDTCISAPSIRYMDRSVENDDFNRGTNWYNRVQGSTYVATLLGYGDWPGNGGWAPQFESIDDRHSEFLGTLFRTRGDLVSPVGRGSITRGWRGVDSSYSEGLTWNVPADSVYGSVGPVEISERNLTPLYLMSLAEMIDKIQTVDNRFSVGGRSRFVVTGIDLVAEYDTWMLRNSSVEGNPDKEYHFEYSDGGLENAFSQFAYQTHVPARSKMYNMDGTPITNGAFLITRSTDNAWACQWIHNEITTSPTMFPVEDVDWTKAVEEYRFDDLGSEEEYNGVSINADVSKIQTPKIVDGVQDMLVIVDGKYVHTYDYTVEIEKSRAEISSYDEGDPSSVELDIVSRTFAILDSPAETLGYLAYDRSSDFNTFEEIVISDPLGNYELSESPDREDILVIRDGLFDFEYNLSGNILSLGYDAGPLTIRYVSHRDEEILPSGSSSYTLSEDSRCKIFVGSRLLEDWAYTREGTSIELPFTAEDDLIIRYDTQDVDNSVSHFHRSTVERNQARFLMDRGRVNGEYDDMMGQTVFMNRGGTPTLLDGTAADTLNVIRRLR